MGIKIKNKIIDDFNKSYDCKLTAEDIIAKTDYFNTSPQTSQKVNPLFKVRYSYVFMYALIIFLSLSVCGLFGYNQYIKKGDYCDQTVEVEPTLTDEDIEYISQYAYKCDLYDYCAINLLNYDSLYIYNSISKDDPNKIIYFYKLVNNFDVMSEYYLTINDSKILINSANSFGKITECKKDCQVHILDFTIFINGIQCNYNLTIPLNLE